MEGRKIRAGKRGDLSMRARALVWLAACSSAACTFEAGNWFATLSPSLSAAYLPRTDRNVGEEQNWQKLSNDYQVRIVRATLELGKIGLLSSTGGGDSGGFDPARPPPGYTLCHNGHCHNVDGRLVPYAEIEAELAGGRSGTGLQPIVTAAGGRDAGFVDALGSDAVVRAELRPRPRHDLASHRPDRESVAGGRCSRRSESATAGPYHLPMEPSRRC